MFKKIKIAFIGCGYVARKHVTALQRLENAELVGAYDCEPSGLTAFGKKYSIPTFSTVEELIEKTNPDLLSILTPSGIHTQNILELIRYKKHFVVEKPLALTLDDTDKILAECDKHNLKVFVVKQNRFNPPIRKLKEAIESGRFGKLVLGAVRVRWCRKQAYYDEKPWRGTWAMDGGVLANQASHYIDMLIWMMGKVESVMAKTATRIANIEVDDTAVTVLKFANGALGVIEATTATRPVDLEGSISVLGEKGSVEIGGYFMNEMKIWNFSEIDKGDQEVWQKHSKVPDQLAWNHSEFYKDVINSLKTNSKGLIVGQEGRNSVDLINAINESSKRGEEVFFNYKNNNL